MSVFEPRGKYQTAYGCAFCRWCDPTTVYDSNPPKYYCSKFNTYVYCGQTTCQSDLEDGQFIGADGHKYHVETKHGKDWSSYSLVDDTFREWLNLSKKAEEKKAAEEKKEKKAELVASPEQMAKEIREAFGVSTIEERLEALEKKVEDLEKRLRNY